MQGLDIARDEVGLGPREELRHILHQLQLKLGVALVAHPEPEGISGGSSADAFD